ncbi:MAG: hypothetical protein DWQ01_08465 [Planctomycetota bacterium]|nr:MAG: hypothetical protein DWQ01_08465 [Planctomycetota bacterium]
MLPNITMKQFVILGILMESPQEMSAKTLKAKLEEQGYRQSAPAFFQGMSRMKKDGLIEAWFDKEIAADGRERRVRKYRLEGSGVHTFRAVVEYLQKLEVKPLRIGAFE